jgi:hypothetical protein
VRHSLHCIVGVADDAQRLVTHLPPSFSLFVFLQKVAVKLDLHRVECVVRWVHLVGTEPHASAYPFLYDLLLFFRQSAFVEVLEDVVRPTASGHVSCARHAVATKLLSAA